MDGAVLCHGPFFNASHEYVPTLHLGVDIICLPSSPRGVVSLQFPCAAVAFVHIGSWIEVREGDVVLWLSGSLDKVQCLKIVKAVKPDLDFC